MRLGVDLGGTKIEIAALDAKGAIVERKRIETPAGDYRGTVEAIATLVHEVEAKLGTRASVGIATPGSRSPARGLIRNANSTCLNGKPLKEDVEARLGREVRMANDANCFALSEAVDGAGRDANVVFGVILGTGVGGAIVVDRRAIEGVNGISCEWGHNPLPWTSEEDEPRPACFCGNRGCIETYLSGPGLAADHRKITGEETDAAQIVKRAAAGDAACSATLERYEARLARSLASVVNFLDPGVIVLGGGLSQVGRLYENVPKLWGAHIVSEEVRTRLVPPVHGDSGGVRGAAWLWND
ncbi:MAG TPA: ROK family protein [Usitatibacter sp.]|nr:ROK family protein [Usitatibacter sp.]